MSRLDEIIARCEAFHTIRRHRANTNADVTCEDYREFALPATEDLPWCVAWIEQAKVLIEQVQASGGRLKTQINALLLEADEPEIEFPTGDGWGEPYIWGNTQAVVWRDGNDELRIRCAQYPDGSRGLFFQCDLYRHWRAPFSIEALRAIEWHKRRPDAFGGEVHKVTTRVSEVIKLEGEA